MSIGPLPRTNSPVKPIVVVAVAAVAAVVLVASLVVLGVFTAGSNIGQSPGNPSSSPSARSVASEFAGRHGTWDLIEEEGVSSQLNATFRYDGPAGYLPCETATWAGAVPMNLSIPAFPGGITSGGSSFWYFSFLAPSNGSELAVYVVSGQVVLAEEFPNACTGFEFSSVQGLSASLVNSSTAVSAAAEAGGADFVSTYADGFGTVTMLLSGGYVVNNTPVAPLWEISWTTCGSELLGSGSTSNYGHDFQVAVNATSGVVVPGSASSAICGVPGKEYTLGLSLELGHLFASPGNGGTISSTGCDNADYCYAVPIVGSDANITPANFTLLVQNSSTTYLGTVGFAILNPNGSVLVYSVGAVEDGWTSDAGTPQTALTGGMTFIADVGPSDPVTVSSVTGSWLLSMTGLGAYAPAGTSGINLDG